MSRLSSIAALVTIAAASHAFACSGSPDSLDDIADHTTVRLKRSPVVSRMGEVIPAGGDTLALTLDVEGVSHGSSTSESSCPELSATFVVNGSNVPTTSRQGGVAHSTSEGCNGSGKVDNYSCAVPRFEVVRPGGAAASTTVELADEDRRWTIRVDDVPSGPVVVSLESGGPVQGGSEVRIRVSPAPGNHDRLSISVYEEAGSGKNELASSARWIDPEVVAFILPAKLFPDIDRPGDVAVAISIAGAFQPHIARCEGPRACVLDGDAYERDIITHQIYVPLAK